MAPLRAGGRVDRIDADVNNESPVAVNKVSGYKGASQFSPKASAIGLTGRAGSDAPVAGAVGPSAAAAAAAFGDRSSVGRCF